MAGKKVLVVNPFVKSFERIKAGLIICLKFSYGNISFEYLTRQITYLVSIQYE